MARVGLSDGGVLFVSGTGGTEEETRLLPIAGLVDLKKVRKKFKQMINIKHDSVIIDDIVDTVMKANTQLLDVDMTSPSKAIVSHSCLAWTTAGQRFFSMYLSLSLRLSLSLSFSIYFLLSVSFLWSFSLFPLAIYHFILLYIAIALSLSLPCFLSRSTSIFLPLSLSFSLSLSLSLYLSLSFSLALSLSLFLSLSLSLSLSL